ncbi:uncharacterized protein C18orf63-like [Belonocnema kinseyi]|uniref:uncharacterized protein C18orf63-like n=1 Tax=Belonocnema kinseyi TaxID=2817044 RepID=UPI00143CC6A0|nr:uncharacterized protein C18orf63-like [Belonocnema kinseyi]
MEPGTTLFSWVPNLKDLCYFCCTVSNSHIMTHEFTKEIHHCQIIYCRTIIRIFSRTLASPVPKSEHCFYVVLSRKYAETNQLQEFFKWKAIHYSDPQEVTFEIYKNCAKYSIIYKLLPVWNRVGEYLCKGQHYSELTDELDAIKFDLDIKEEGLFLQFNPVKLKLTSLSLEVIGVTGSTLVTFQNNPKMPITFRHQKAHIIAYILPSLKKCKLLKVTKEIPNTCKFKQYHVIRDHWKNMYGIVLPKKKEGINFYELSFEGFEERTFVYPETCLQAKLPKIIECCNQADITHQFLEDLKVKVPQICGKELSFVYQNVKPIENFLKPNEVHASRGINDTPSKSSISGNSNFFESCSLKSSNVFTYDPKATGIFSFKINFNSKTKSSADNLASSFKNKLNNSSKLQDSEISLRSESVSNWLLNSCDSPGISQETESQTSVKDFEKSRDSPLKKRMKFSGPKKAIIRSIECTKVSLSPFRRANMKNKNIDVPRL